MILQYRNATLADLPRIVEIYNSTIAGRMVTADTELVTVADKREWFSKHTERRPVEMIFDNTNEIGWISFSDFYGRPAYSGTAEISIYFHPDHRNKGYGMQVLKDCISKAPSLQIHTLLGVIFAHNQHSIHLFSRAGFTEWGNLPDVAVMDGKYYSVKIFGLHV